MLAGLALLGCAVAWELGRLLTPFYGLVVDARRGKPSYFAAMGLGADAGGAAKPKELL